MGKLMPHAASFRWWVAMSEVYRAEMQKLRKGSARLKRRLVKQAWGLGLGVGLGFGFGLGLLGLLG